MNIEYFVNLGTIFGMTDFEFDKTLRMIFLVGLPADTGTLIRTMFASDVLNTPFSKLVE